MGITDAQRAQIQSIASKAGFTPSQGSPGSAKAAGFVLRDSVLASFFDWSVQFEGYETFLYTDSKGYVTTGVGNLVDPIGAALSLPWKNADGSASSAAEITAAWNAVKQAWPGVESVNCAKLTTIRLDKDGVRALVNAKLKSNDAYLAAHLPGYADYPADGQLFCNSMAWALGAGWPGIFKNVAASLAKSPPDWSAAADQCTISSANNPGIIPRNYADALLCANAAAVAGGTGDPAVLYYLTTPTGSPGGGGIFGSSDGSGLGMTTTVLLALVALGAGFYFGGGMGKI